MLQWFQRLMPRQDAFFPAFERHGAVMVKAAVSLREMLAGGYQLKPRFQDILDLEHEADSIFYLSGRLYQVRTLPLFHVGGSPARYETVSEWNLFPILKVRRALFTRGAPSRVPRPSGSSSRRRRLQEIGDGDTVEHLSCQLGHLRQKPACSRKPCYSSGSRRAGLIGVCAVVPDMWGPHNTRYMPRLARRSARPRCPFDGLMYVRLWHKADVV